MFLIDARQPEVVFQMFGQIVSMIVKTLGNTNFAASSCFNPLSPNSDQQQFSPNDINTLS